MSTAWGLDLDMSAVRLMRRNGENWDEIQTEAIDSPDIEERLNAMLSHIDSGAEVTLFLPLDQILCTDVEIAGEDDTKAEIERAMDGRTPYALDELVLDWDIVAPGQARVAAIAQDTLDEAAAFAEVRNIGVSTYSSLGLGDAFPRLPSFAGPHVPSAMPTEFIEKPETDETPTEAAPEDAAMFATARKPSRPPLDEKPTAPSSSGDTLILKPEPGTSIEVSDTPVVQVDDATPVMLVKGPKLDLKAEAPLTGRVARPRVRTDIAAGTLSGSAASLSPSIRPGGSVQVHRRRSPLATTALVFAAAFVLTIGIATLVWSLLPLSPDRNTSPTQAETGLIDTQDSPEIEIAAPEPELDALPKDKDVADGTLDTPAPDTPEEIAALPETEDELVPETVTSEDDALAEVEEPAEPDVPDLPQPVIFAEIAQASVPEVGELPLLETKQDTAPVARLSTLEDVGLPGTQLPVHDAEPPLAIAPEALANILKTAPNLPTAPEDAERLEDIVVASIETSELASDAIALPSVFGLQADDLPQIAAAPPAPESLVEDAPDVAALPPNQEPSLIEAEGFDDIAAAEPIEEAPEVAAFGPGPEQVPQAHSVGDAFAATEEVPVEATPEVAALAPETEVPQDYSVDDALAAAVTQALTDALAGPGGLVQTEHAAALPDTEPRRRPQGFVETIERDQFGGRTRTELATLRPPARPASEQSAEPAGPPSTLAVARSLAPRLRPDNFGALVAAARVQREAERLSASVNTRTPDTSSAVQAALSTEPQQPVREARRPNIPTSASVARQATIDNAFRLNRVNLVGVYGAASDRRALVRLPSGRYVKVKVGDRVDGGTVAQITDRELIYRKGSRTLSLEIPQS